MTDKKTCFVVMGFGKKTDHRQGKTFDLDKTYRTIIKPAVETAGLVCIRADEIQHSGVIDLPMYEQLLNADVVVADLSTANFNAAYELGVRHGLKPYSTIAMAEQGFASAFPFDVSHTVLLTYEHLESGIDYEEVVKTQAALTEAVKAAAEGRGVDSPVYTFLSGLEPPSLKAAAAAASRDASGESATAAPSDEERQTIAGMRSAAEKAKGDGDWNRAVAMWGALADMDRADPFFVQQHALATYKAAEKAKDDPEQPRAGYLAAAKILESLKPERSADPETLGIWAAVHKRLYEKGGETDEEARGLYLERAITALQKGFFILNDYYNGINLAYMLDVRAAASTGDDAITDHTMARRVREKVAEICEVLIAQGDFEKGDEYWLKATAWEACVGLGDAAGVEKWKERALAVDGFQDWMRETTEGQIAKLRELLPA